jgi:hypothetical protein
MTGISGHALKMMGFDISLHNLLSPLLYCIFWRLEGERLALECSVAKRRPANASVADKDRDASEQTHILHIKTTSIS